MAAPFTLSNDGIFPDVAVDGEGTGHFVWRVRDNGPQPDALHYCRVPRGQTACATEKTFKLSPPDEHRPHVVIANDGRIVLLDYRCCSSTPTPDGGSNLDVVYAITSSDGGLTFDDPRIVGTQDPSGDAVFGPGEFNVSLISSQTTGGVKFQSTALDGYTESTATLGDLGGGVRGQNDGGIGFTNPLTPIAVFTDQTNVYFRKYNAGDYNDVGSWGPGQTIDQGDLPRISTTPAAQPYVLYITGPPAARKYVVRRFNGEGFDPPIDVSGPTGPLSGQIFADASGSQHVFYRENGDLKYRLSTDGKTFANAQTPATSADGGFSDMNGAAAKDTGGWLVWDENDAGPVKAVPVGPQTLPVGDGPPGGCSKSVTLTGTPATVVTQGGGCFTDEGGGRFSTAGDVRVNGVDVLTGAAPTGKARAAATDVKVTVDTKKRTIKTDTKVTVMAGNVKLDEAKLDWTVSKSGKLNGALPDVGKFKFKLLGFPIDGEADIDFKKGGEARIPLQVRLPAPYDGITGEVVLRLTQDQGLVLDDFHIGVENMALGPLYIRNLDVRYTGGGENRFLGRAAFFIPPIAPPPKDMKSEKGAIEVSFEFQGGEFIQASVDSFPLTGLYPPSGLPLYTPYVYLTELGFGLRRKPQLIFRGGATLIGLPDGAGTGLVELDALPQGDITPDPATEGFKLKLSDPAEFSMGGKLKVVGIPFAHGNVFFSTAGIFSFGGSIDFTDPTGYLFHFDAGIPDNGAFIDLKHGLFSLTSKQDLCLLADCTPYKFETKLSANNNGFGICGTLPLPAPPIKIGFGFDVKTKEIEFTGCDLSKYEGVSGASAKAAQAGGGVLLKGGMPEAGVQIMGESGAPKVIVAGPGGEQIQSSSTEPVTTKDNMVLVESPAEKATYLFIKNPTKGGWAIGADTGSSEIAAFRIANGLPPASVKASVGGKGRKRVLSYRIKRIPGQKVTFVEQGIAGGALIGAARKARGKLRFRPGEGPGGKRNIIAMIEQGGRVRDNRRVASYVAPPPVRPGKPGKLRLKRVKKGVQISWGRAQGAARYRVRVVLSRDGRRLLQLVKPARLVVPDLLPKEKVTVAVTGIGSNQRAGPTRQATVKFKPRKPRRERRRGNR